MMKRIGLCFFVLALSCAGSAYAQCVVDTSTPTYANGAFLRYTPCDANGKIKTTGSGGGGGGDASEAEQQTQTGILTTIDADTGTIAGAVKAEDAAHSSGHTGIPFWGVRNDSAATSLTDTNGDYTPIATDSNGRLFINAISSIFSVTPGTTATALGKAEDAAHASGDTGVMVLCVRQDTEAALATTNGDYIPCATDATGRMWTNTELPAAAALADTTANPTVPGVAAYNMCFNGTTWDRCTGTSTLHYATSTASTNATNIKNAAGTVSTISVVNTTATLYYLRMYNLASAPTCSSATGFVNTIPIPASTSGAGIVIPITLPHAYTTGIGYCLTGGGSSTDNTNAATGVYINIWYK
jgi:hypothetical protein